MQTQENGPGQKPGEDRQTAVSDIGQTDMAAAARQGQHRPGEREGGRERSGPRCKPSGSLITESYYIMYSRLT